MDTEVSCNRLTETLRGFQGRGRGQNRGAENMEEVKEVIKLENAQNLTRSLKKLLNAENCD